MTDRVSNFRSDADYCITELLLLIEQLFIQYAKNVVQRHNKYHGKRKIKLYNIESKQACYIINNLQLSIFPSFFWIYSLIP